MSELDILGYSSSQCQYFVLRKKRLCRMTVKTGKRYCGEHEPQPETVDRQDNTRIPCPNDPKHTCYASKLQKHLTICNARQRQQPSYIIHNVNVPASIEDCPRLPLSKIPLKKILTVIEKVHDLYDKYLKDKITTLVEQPIHNVVLPEFNEVGRTESSLRHLRQASMLLHIVESEQSVANNTAYVELGAGKGHLSYYAWHAWCHGTDSRVLLVDRAALRHKRDNKLGRALCSDVRRIRADLAHLALGRVPGVRASGALVGYAKHLCGAATDLALRCVTAPGAAEKARGVFVASCCHHRCERALYPASALLQKLGIDADDFNALLGIVSWATCGDGRSRDRRYPDTENPDLDSSTDPRLGNRHPGREVDTCGMLRSNPLQYTTTLTTTTSGSKETTDKQESKPIHEIHDACYDRDTELGAKNLNLSREQREVVGRRAKALLDWGRVLYLKEHGFDARLVYYVPSSVSLENVCIVARKAA